MTARATVGFGVMVVDSSDMIAFAGGTAASPSLQTKLLEDLAGKRAQGSGMLAIEDEQAAIVTYRSLGDTLVFLVQPTDSRSTLFEFIANVEFADAIFSHLVENPYTSMVVVDDKGRVQFLPKEHEQFFGLKPGEGLGKHVSKVIHNSKLHEVALKGKSEFGSLLELNGATRVVSRTPIKKDGITVGAIGQLMFNEPEKVHLLSQEVARLRTDVEFYRKALSGVSEGGQQFEHMVGNSDALRQLKSDILKVAPLKVPVLIVGESGTGKELAAQAIHALSACSQNRMVIVNAAAIPGSLVEAELFGYESGSFTGAEKGGRRGKFELANNSSLFFDEMGDMPLEIQVKLLRVLQDGMFERVGGQRICHSDFRLISASNRNFQEIITTGQFRLDLYYRISGVTIRMPSLRERLEDVPLLVERFLAAFAKRHRMSIKRVDSRVYDFLREQAWPGNVRQLLHEVEKAAIFCDGPEITVESFRLIGSLQAARPLVDAPPVQTPLVDMPAAVTGVGPHKFQDAIDALEKSLISEAMTRHRGNKKKVAEELGISRGYLYKKLPG